MADIPKNLQSDPLADSLQSKGLKRISQGKVRDTYYLDDERLLVVASDRISIFEFGLNTLVPRKGEVLTALTHFWPTKVFGDLENHLIPAERQQRGAMRWSALNAVLELYEDGFVELPVTRCLVVKNLIGKMYPFEMIFRHHIGGSVYGKYLKTGIAGGTELPKGLPKWSKLDKPIFTPSTKEAVGHDINVDADYFFKTMSDQGLGEEANEVVALLTEAYSRAYQYAQERGILILDTKFEVAGKILADEFITPDSSRFCTEADWQQAMAEGRDPRFLNKQPVRDWGMTIETPFFDKDGKKIIGINKLKPENNDHVTFVHSLKVPDEIVSETTDRYLTIFEMITGMSLHQYQITELGCE